MPVSAGSASTSFRHDSRPPAEAPMPTTGESLLARGGRRGARGTAGSIAPGQVWLYAKGGLAKYCPRWEYFRRSRCDRGSRVSSDKFVTTVYRGGTRLSLNFLVAASGHAVKMTSTLTLSNEHYTMEIKCNECECDRIITKSAHQPSASCSVVCARVARTPLKLGFKNRKPAMTWFTERMTSRFGFGDAKKRH